MSLHDRPKLLAAERETDVQVKVSNENALPGMTEVEITTGEAVDLAAGLHFNPARAPQPVAVGSPKLGATPKSAHVRIQPKNPKAVAKSEGAVRIHVRKGTAGIKITGRGVKILEHEESL